MTVPTAETKARTIIQRCYSTRLHCLEKTGGEAAELARNTLSRLCSELALAHGNYFEVGSDGKTRTQHEHARCQRQLEDVLISTVWESSDDMAGASRGETMRYRTAGERGINNGARAMAVLVMGATQTMCRSIAAMRDDCSMLVQTLSQMAA